MICFFKVSERPQKITVRFVIVLSPLSTNMLTLCQSICRHCVREAMTISSQFNIVVDYVTLHFLTVWNNIFFLLLSSVFFNKKNNLLGIQRSLWLLGHYVHVVNVCSDMILCTAYNYNADTHFSQISLQNKKCCPNVFTCS